MSIKYQRISFNPNLLHPKNIDRLAIERVKPNSFVLDVGCATGFMGEYLIKNKNCKVIGLEERFEEALKAKKKLHGIVVANVEEKDIDKKILKATNGEKFDVVLATSLIEHLKNPTAFLLAIKKVVKKDGYLLITTPNIAHFSIRLALLKGNFDYTKYGILDETHLHFFTLKSFRQLFENSGYIVRDLVIDPVGGGYPRIGNFLSRFFPNIFAYQMLIVAKLT